MQEQDKLSAKQIVRNISKTPWSEGEKSINQHGVHCQDINASGDVTGIATVNGMTDTLYPYSGKADISAILTAVNNTYGKGLNPEVYEDVVNAAEDYLDCSFEDKKKWAAKLEKLLDALEKARI